MEFHPDAREESFRVEVRRFVREHLASLFPQSALPSWAMRFFSREEMQRWTRALDARGWAVPQWPVEWGGARWPAAWRDIRDQELILAHAPTLDPISMDFVGPVLYTFGSLEQKRRYLPRIRTAEDFWCQGFSESGAGSDVMQLQTVATRHGDHFVVKGHKLWTSNAHNSDMMFALVRIEVPGTRRQNGLSFLLIDMRSPGITVRPIRTLDGRHWVNEVALESVRVPLENLVGEPGKGWIYARLILKNERTVIAGLAALRQQLEGVRMLLDEPARGVASEATDESHRRRYAQMEMELEALEFLQRRALHADAEDAEAAIFAPVLKLRGSELRQSISELTIDVLGDRGLESLGEQRLAADGSIASAELPRFFAREATAAFLFNRSATLAGGTSEIQRNIISAMGLGL